MNTGSNYPHPSSPAVTAVMRANRSRDTAPELRLRSALHKIGLRFRKSYVIRSAAMRVRADIAFPRKRVAIFVDGCFWHCCPDHGIQPSVNRRYWLPKLAHNVERDRLVDTFLTAMGWKVIRVWEHEVVEQCAARIDTILDDSESARCAVCP